MGTTAENHFTRSMQNTKAPHWTSSCLDLHGGGALQRQDYPMRSKKHFKTAQRSFGSIQIRKTRKRSHCIRDLDFNKMPFRSTWFPRRKSKTQFTWNCIKTDSRCRSPFSGLFAGTLSGVLSMVSYRLRALTQQTNRFCMQDKSGLLLPGSAAHSIIGIGSTNQ